MFETEAESKAIETCPSNLDMPTYVQGFVNGAEFGYNKGKAETALLSQHILDLQKDKGNLTDRVRELEQQIEKMKCCENCKNYSPTYGLCCYSLGDEDYDCRLRKWEIKENDKRTN